MRVPIDFITIAERRAWIETDGKTYWIESDRGERLGPDGWEGNPESPYYRPYSFTHKDEAVLRYMLESAQRKLEELNWLRMQFDPDFAVQSYADLCESAQRKLEELNWLRMQFDPNFAVQSYADLCEELDNHDD